MTITQILKASCRLVPSHELMMCFYTWTYGGRTNSNGVDRQIAFQPSVAAWRSSLPDAMVLTSACAQDLRLPVTHSTNGVRSGGGKRSPYRLIIPLCGSGDECFAVFRRVHDVTWCAWIDDGEIQRDTSSSTSRVFQYHDHSSHRNEDVMSSQSKA